MPLPTAERPGASGPLHRASVACKTCRLRKVKCDAQFAPSEEGCGPCRRAGQQCLLDPQSDGRRRTSVSRKFVADLQQRIQMLEALNQGLPPHRFVLSAPSTMHPPSHRTFMRGAWLTVSSTVPSTNSAGAAPISSTSTLMSPPALPASTLLNRESPENVPGGSPTFFGATSHPHVTSPGDEAWPASFDDDVDAVGIDLDTTSPRLRDHLLQAYFKYQTLWVDVVNKETFLTHRANGDRPRWYSKFLENAMLACGTRLSTSKAVRALGVKYLAWAKDEVLRAMAEPTPANLQGFLLLSEYEVTQGNDRPGWMFCGVACRMLSDLGLHELASITGPPQAVQESAKESDLAYGLLSACVVYEGVWTLYLGRPSSIPSSVMNVAASRCKAGRKSDAPWLNAWVGLCVPMAEISHVLNEESIRDSDRAASLRKLFSQVEEWYENLPPDLSYDEKRLINLDLAGYGLHTQYCKVQILLRQALARPSNSKKRRHSQIAREKEPLPPSDNTNDIIYKYAVRIARLVVTYREGFGVEEIPSIMLDNAVVAATEMLRHLRKADDAPGMQQQTVWLRYLLKSLETVQPHFPIVRRMLDSLKQICGDNSPLCRMFPSARRNSVHAPALGLPAQSDSSFQASPRPNVAQEVSIGGGAGAEIVWDNIDCDSIFSFGRFDDFVLPDIAPSDSLISHLAQQVT
ncbi:hypothetical protein BU16DRAFT_550722 [Lophium mytilinum]|uniref:Zn(2)-C6 fungal-type domain-containing protein n=1 Tax=Lophium mytilinum TaxID=390894 RepID=A0A6A6QSA5_9PEZI|nr:hypothetical protein BU16DRAFT_550722 [Lophium mytilinum]